MGTDYSGWDDEDTERYMASRSQRPSSVGSSGTYSVTPENTREDGDVLYGLAPGVGGNTEMRAGWGAPMAGRRSNTYTIGSPLSNLEPQDLRFASDAVLTDYINSHYGYFAGYMNNPEIKGILLEAARWQWDEGKLYARMTQTGWWQSTSAAQRTWQKLQNEDPAEARRLVGQTAATIQNRARSLGLPMSGGQIAGLAATATANGWTDAQTIDNLVGQVNWNTLEGGDLTAARDQVKAIGGDYLVGVSDETAQGYAAKIASGEMTAAGVQSIMLKQAKARFGWMSEELDQGATVKDFFAPIRDVIARELELATEDVDMMDSKWLSLMEVKGDDGKMRAASMNEAMLAARQKPEWSRTNKSQELTANMSSMIGNLFGRGAI